MRARLRVWCILVSLAAPAASAATPPPLFSFHSGFWLNLHHFLYVLGRAANNTADSRRRAVSGAAADAARAEGLSTDERAVWNAAVAEYQRTLSPKDPIFDPDLAAFTRTLAQAGDDPAPPSSLPQNLRDILAAAAPVYRKVWWQGHARANRERIDEIETLLAPYGRPIAEFVARAWRQTWPPAGFRVQVSAYANWAGAYSTRGGLIVLSSTDPGNAGSQGLEAVVHEAMHQWDRPMQALIDEIARRIRRPVPPQLAHALIFYTAGCAVARTVPGHRPYAALNGLWAPGVLVPLERLDAHWLPYLQGKATLEDAIAALLTTAGNGPDRVK